MKAEIAGSQEEKQIMELEPQNLFIYASEVSGDGRLSGNIMVEICCDSMELAADMVQDICKYFGIGELDSEASFPREMKVFEDVLQRVADLNSDRVRLNADMAEDSQRVKALIVRAEDARLMVDMETMRRAYTDL